MPRGPPHGPRTIPTSTMAPDAGEREHEDGVQSWLTGFPAYKMDLARSGRASTSVADYSEGDDNRRRRHRALFALSASSASCLLPQLPPLSPSVFLALDTREKLVMCDAIGMLVRLGVRVVDTGAGGLDVRGEMWRSSYAGF
ncbi:hypothetical protein BJV74DRAFT_889887 [Russula compacta]|nr:hypothetical protein BJV74DRAFT_889887 [Russula compacta]